MKALELALQYLERRARTEAEIRQKLSDNAVPPQEVEAVLAKLKEYGYIDDVKLASNFQRIRDDYKPMGIGRIKLELKHKGVPKEIIQTISAEREQEFALATRAAASRRRQYEGLDAQTFRRRMTGFLSRRGFNYDIILRVLKSLS